MIEEYGCKFFDIFEDFSKQSMLLSQGSFKLINIIGKFIKAAFKILENDDIINATYINILKIWIHATLSQTL